MRPSPSWSTPPAPAGSVTGPGRAGTVSVPSGPPPWPTTLMARWRSRSAPWCGHVMGTTWGSLPKPWPKSATGPAAGRRGAGRQLDGDVHVLAALDCGASAGSRWRNDAVPGEKDGDEPAERDRPDMVGGTSTSGSLTGSSKRAAWSVAKCGAARGRPAQPAHRRAGPAGTRAKRSSGAGPASSTARICSSPAVTLWVVRRDGGDVTARDAERLEPLEHHALGGDPVGGLGHERGVKDGRERLPAIVQDPSGEDQRVAARLEQGALRRA